MFGGLTALCALNTASALTAEAGAGHISFADSAMGCLSLTEQAAQARNPATAQGDLPGFICQHPCLSISWIHHVDPWEVVNEGL